jgi:hypothetical protein
MSNELVNFLNIFNNSYYQIRPDLSDAISGAIRVAESSREFETNPRIIELLRILVERLSTQASETEAVNSYMLESRGSVTRPFFYYMTIPGNLFPEDRPVYPPAPVALPRLEPSFATHFDMEDQLIMPLQQVYQNPPRIDVFMGNPGPQLPHQVPEEFQASAPSALPRNILPNEIEDGEIFE